MDILKLALFAGAGFALYKFTQDKGYKPQAYSVDEFPVLMGGEVYVDDKKKTQSNLFSNSNNPFKDLNFNIEPFNPFDIKKHITSPVKPEKTDALNTILPVKVNYMNEITDGWVPPMSAVPYVVDINKAEIANGIPKRMLARLLFQESHFIEDVIFGRKLSPVGAIGIAQVMPATANQPGYGVLKLKDPTNPKEAITWAASYLKAMYRAAGNSWPKALAAYNAGLGTVNKQVKLKGANWLDGMPLETRNYVNQIAADIPAVYGRVA